ncbi:hypothetical protein L0E83_11460 [Marichromatium gracile]|uniref:Uncharacterized protein n=1 Tax=Marichromatium gracile TaxID=1048 RepID=A0ABR5VII7_MARGR|nr:hypothetical protein [Marichromatium gracile]KXX64023.1 hypothetical protein AY586_14945 [Marichromatium gracile]MCF1184047.1 hypothetical protein [Marichromatium gracile]
MTTATTPRRRAAAPAASGTACRIESARPGLYCCGVSHPARVMRYPDGFFSAAQLATLAAHPELRVERLGGEGR